MNIELFKEQVRLLENEMREYYEKYSTETRKPIIDGIVDLETYFNSKIKIMWVLKEPYDDGNDRGGNWKMTDGLKNRANGKYKNSSALTFLPIIYSTYAVLNNIDSFDKLDQSKRYSLYSKYLKNIAYINVQKMPARKSSNFKDINSAYESDAPILKKQIDLYNPDVLIFGGTFRHFKNELNLSKDNQINNSCYKLGARLLINIYHPMYGYRRYKGDYINKIISNIKVCNL